VAGARPLILFFNSFFGARPDIAELTAEEQAAFSYDVTRFLEADMVVFHIPDLRDMSRLEKPPGQLWAAWSMESAVNYPRLVDADFMRRFDITITYRRDADIWTAYVPTSSQWAGVFHRPIPPKTEPAPIVMVQSALYDQSGRAGYTAGLMAEFQIDSYGRVFNTRRFPHGDAGRPTKLDTISRYKFYLAFENSVAPDYVTEKLFDALMAGTVPIYLGAPNVDDFLPGDNAIINVRDFPTPHGLARYIKALLADERAYRQYFAWRDRQPRKAFLALTEPREPVFRQLLDIARRKIAAR
jgi:alpha-1,3-fucosyltransferase 10